MSSWETRQANSNRILDTAARERRAKKALEALEKDNFQDEFDDEDSSGKRGPQLGLDPFGGSNKKKKQRPADYYKNKYIKSWQYLLEEDENALHCDRPSYANAEAPYSSLPKRQFCSVCGYFASYTCVKCGAKYCQPKCLMTHSDTRCLKWTA